MVDAQFHGVRVRVECPEMIYDNIFSKMYNFYERIFLWNVK
jgi:hypothetical protein